MLVENGVVVGLRAVDSDDLFLPVFRKMIHQELGLELAHFYVVESHIKIQIAIGDQAIVSQHWNAGVMRHIDGFRHGATVMRNDHENINTPADQRLDVANLPGVITVR